MFFFKGFQFWTVVYNAQGVLEDHGTTLNTAGVERMSGGFRTFRMNLQQLISPLTLLTYKSYPLFRMQVFRKTFCERGNIL